MSDRWAARLARVDAAIDRVMAEALLVIPMAARDFSPSLDEGRPPFEVDGVLTIHRGETDFGGIAEHLRNTQVRISRAEAQINKALLPAGATIRKGDRLAALDQPGLVFMVDRVDTEHPGRLALALTLDRTGAVSPEMVAP